MKPCGMEPLDLKAIGDRIRKLRGTKGFRSQQALAEALGVSLPTVNRWETGKSAPEEKLPALCEALGVTAEHLLYGLGYGARPGDDVKLTKWRHVFESPQGQRLSQRQRIALIELIDELDPPEWRVLAMVELLMTSSE